MEQTKTPSGRRRKQAAPIGMIFILLAVIGLAAVLIFSIKLTKDFIDNADQKTKFESLILPVLMFDPVPFENANDLEPLVLLQSSMWSALLGEKRGDYPYDELKLLLVPASDLDVAAAKLFGPDVELEHQSFGNYETSFIYDEETQTYHVPAVAQMGTYSPRIETITKKGDTIQLRVGYIPPTTLWTVEQENEGGEQQPDKTMLYVLTKNKRDYYISAIRDVEGAGLPGGDNAASLAPIALPDTMPGDGESESGLDEEGESQSPEESGEESSSEE